MNDFAYPIGFKFDIEGHEAEIVGRSVSVDRSNWYVIETSVVRVGIPEHELTDIIKKAKKKEVKEPVVNGTYTKEQVLSFGSYICEGTEEEILEVFLEWEQKEEQRKSDEYREYMRLKKIYG